MCAYCRLGKLDKDAKVFGEIKNMSYSPTGVSYNALILGYSSNYIVSKPMNLKTLMKRMGCTYSYKWILQRRKIT